MAFTYNNPLSIAINKLPSKQSDQLLSLTTDEIEKSLGVINSFFAFSIKPEEQELLGSKGVQLAPIGFKTHSHPMCKMVENHLLYIVIPGLLKAFRSVAFFSLRPSKHDKFISMFQAFHYGKIKSLGMYNALIDSKDRFRYGDSPFSCFKDRVDGLLRDCGKANKFPKVLFLHDELHFLTPFDIAYLFEKIPEIGQVVCTTVCPVELLMGDTVSKEPRVYSYKVHGSTFSFYPDGVASECYEQHIGNTTWPFRTSCIKWANRSVRVSKLYSLFAHHVFSFDRGRHSNQFNHFDKPSCLLSEELKVLTNRFATGVINRSTVSSLSTYMACLKTANAASAVAKLRQLEKRDLYPDELNFVYSFGEHFKNFGMRDDFDISVLQWVKDKFCQVMPNFISKTFFESDCFHLNFRKLMNDLATKGLEIETEELRLDKVNWIEFNFFERMIGIANAIGVDLKTLNKRYHFDTQSEPYHSREGYIFFELSGKDHILITDTVDIKKLHIAARPFRLIRDFVLRISKGQRPIQRKFIEFGEARPLENKKEERREDEECQTSKLIDTKDEVNFEGQIPCDLIDAFTEASAEKVEIKKFKRKNDCVFKALAEHLGKDTHELMNDIANEDISDELMDCIDFDKGLSHEMITEVLILLGLTMCCTEDFKDMYVLNRKYGVNGKLYCVIKNNHCSLSTKDCFVKLLKEGSNITPDSLSLNADSLFDIGPFVNSRERALKLAKSLNRGTTGLLKEIDPETCSRILEAAEMINHNFTSELGLRFGFAGSGKTHGVIQWINMTPSVKRMFISPRRALADEVRPKLKGTNCQIHTLETALKKIDMNFVEVFVDELGLYPPGYLSILQIAAASKLIKGATEKRRKESMNEVLKKPLRINAFGDPLQIRYYSPEDNQLLEKDHEIDLALKGRKIKYLLQGYRFGSWFREILNIPVKEDDSKLNFKFYNDLANVRIEDYSAILVAGRDSKGGMIGKLPVYTISESQGCTFDKKTLITLDSNFFAGGAYATFVALTRSRVGFDFFIMKSSLKEISNMAKKTLLDYVFQKKQIPIEKIVNLIPGASFYETPLAVGNSSIQDKAQHDLFIMPFINLAEEENDPEEIKGEIVEAPTWFKTHVPIFDCDPMLAEIFEKVEAKEKREFQSMLGLSNQFLDIEKNGCKIDILPFARQNVFPHHQASDDVTFWEGVRKRIRKSNWRKEASKYEEFKENGKLLLKEFLSMLPEDFEVTIEDIEKGEKSFLEKRKQKTEKMWENHSERSDIDWSLDHVFLFMKSQYCTKEGKMFTTAKAGQTLACFQHIVLFKFGPMLRAIENAFMRAVGESYYIHSGKNFFSLDAFVTMNADKFDGESIESDYTAFDSSQDHVILAFEMCLLEKLGVSKEFQMDYLRLKLTLGCRLGSLAIMRFTGEFCTFLFNTFANMLFTKLKYKIDPAKHRILFAGDDMCSLSSLKRRRSEKAQRLLKTFSLTAVEEVRKYPMFCGWYLSPFGILKSPKLLWARIKMMQERQLIRECVDNYLFEAIFAYRLGERLYYILKEEDFEYHYLVIRFFVKNSKLLTGLSKSLIFEIGEGIGNSEWRSSTSTRSLLELNQVTSRLTLSKHLSFTMMPHSSNRQYSTVSKDLRPTSKLLQRVGKTCTWQTSACSTKTKLTTSKRCLKNINTSMSVSSLSPFEQCFRISKESQEWSLCMTGHALTKTKVNPLLQPTNSLSRGIHVISPCGRNMYFQQQTLILLICCDLLWIWNARNMQRTESCLHWISGLLIGCAMPPDFWIQEKEVVTGPIRPLKAVPLLNLDQRFLISCQDPSSSLNSLMKGQICLSRRECSERMNTEGPEACQREEQQIRKDLGPFLLCLKEVLGLKDLGKMSLEGILMRMRRHRVEVYLWKTYIDPKGELIPHPPPESKDDEKFEGEEVFLTVVKHYCKFLFGNIAVFGSSDKTLYPGVRFKTPQIHFDKKQKAKENETEEEKKQRAESSGTTKEWEMSLASIAPELKSWAKNHQNNSINECTWRKLCEPFADLAYEFLHERWQTGLSTNIYKKWPKALEKAPWVAFDFASGLPMYKLSPDERQVIDRMTKRLFRTEGQKGVFEAGAESNLELEG